MSVHVVCSWDGKSVPEAAHVDAVVVALRQNHARLGSRWTPPAFAVVNPADSVMFAAAQVLDICGRTPRGDELDAAVAQAPHDRRAVLRGFLKQVFKRLESPGE